MASASAHVFGIVELLECILLHLPAADVTRARRINSFCRNSIDNSTPLRRVMFLEPILECDHETYQIGSDTYPSYYKIFSVHPAISTGHESFQAFDFEPPPAYWFPGQWRDMLITQPPVEDYGLRYHNGCATIRGRVHRGVTIKGNTLGALCEALETVAITRPGSTIESVACCGKYIDERLVNVLHKRDMEERRKAEASKARKLAYNRDKRARFTVPSEDWELAIVHEKQARRKDRKDFEGFGAADVTDWGFIGLFGE